MNGRSFILLVVGLSSVAGDYARYEEFVRQQSKNETFVRLFKQFVQQLQDQSQTLRTNVQEDITFPCTPYPQPEGKTTSVHKLRPMDVKVIGAIGDSITAGTGIKASTVIGLLKEDRGLSWSVGGDGSIKTEITLPNILRVYGTDVKGYSRGWGPVWMESVSHLNLANPGDKSENMPGQAEDLVERMKREPGVNFNDDWKVITVFVGGNDLCDFCDDKEKFRAENYVAHIQTALDYLHANVPRAFVNLVEILDISVVKRLNQNLVCDALHLFLCACAAYPADSEAEAELQMETVRYRELMNQMVLSGRYDTRDDFTVVVQPFFRNTMPPDLNGKPDLSYFAPDCFHLSLKGHRAATEALWNNMIEPVGKKRTMWTPGELVECPTAEAPYFYTYKNSPGSYLGSPFSPDQDLSDTEAEQNPAGRSGSSSLIIATVVSMTGVIVLVLSVVVGWRVWKNRHSKSGEKTIMFKAYQKRAYEAI